MGREGAVSFFMLESVSLNEQLHCAFNGWFIHFLVVWFNALILIPGRCRNYHSFLVDVEIDLLVHSASFFFF